MGLASGKWMEKQTEMLSDILWERNLINRLHIITNSITSSMIVYNSSLALELMESIRANKFIR